MNEAVCLTNDIVHSINKGLFFIAQDSRASLE